MRPLLLLGFAIALGWLYGGHVAAPAIEVANEIAGVLPSVAEAHGQVPCTDEQ